ncbi:hypothetical protein [Pseudoalteromonas luteoviolacea]|uniref:hypothetical protein n=1 Tax=Pseudoalteromonas luteoviolacea TaxID=43657 RepID=UPI001B3787FE|nr:hypothetical protein [Pseudoalteromonas luteoviolacea]MBQ4837347.1 hypothetical protein [Pseudoalteromonas luteoviolacea]
MPRPMYQAKKFLIQKHNFISIILNIVNLTIAIYWLLNPDDGGLEPLLVTAIAFSSALNFILSLLKSREEKILPLEIRS